MPDFAACIVLFDAHSAQLVVDGLLQRAQLLVPLLERLVPLGVGGLVVEKKQRAHLRSEGGGRGEAQQKRAHLKGREGREWEGMGSGGLRELGEQKQ